MVNMNNYTDEILSPHDNFNVIFRCVMCGMEVDRQIRFSDNYFAGISPITAPHRAEEFGAESNFDALKTLKTRWREDFEHIGITYEEMLEGEINRLRNRMTMKGFDPNAKIGSPKYAEEFGAESKLTKEEIIKYLSSNSADYLNDGLYYKVNEDTWTLCDLFIRQYLNNLVDGFGMVNVKEVYQYLCKHKDLLIEYNMVSKDGWNNSGLTLWENYNFDDYLERFGAEGIADKKCHEYFGHRGCEGTLWESPLVEVGCDTCDLETIIYPSGYGGDGKRAEEFGADDFCMTCGAKDKRTQHRRVLVMNVFV